MPIETRSLGELTAGQSKFAQENHAQPSLLRAARDPRQVFMYREDPDRTSRWLIDESGRVTDAASFRHARSGG